MNASESKTNWRPATATVMAGLMVIAGFLLTGVSWWWLLLTAAGAFGPGILRELGWLHDKDEFQLQSAHRAGYHAYVTSGLMAFLLVTYFRSSEKTIDHTQELATLFLAILLFTWFLSSLISYWGAPRAAFRFLISFGCAWFVFAIASNVGKEWAGWAAMLLHPMLTIPFFALAWLSTRWPKLTGGLLLAASAFFVQFFGLFRNDHVAIVNQAVTFLLFVGPLLASGTALLSVGSPVNESDENDHAIQSETKMVY